MLQIRLLLLDVAPFWFVEHSTNRPTPGDYNESLDIHSHHRALLVANVGFFAL
jgi:hypothetical protein